MIYFASADENGLKHFPIKETDSHNPENKYGLVKSLTMKYVKDFCKDKNIKYTFFKLFLVVGRSQCQPRLFPLIKKNIKYQNTFLINTPNHIKNILYIDEFTFILNKILSSKNSVNQIYNLGSDKNISMINLCKKIKKYNKNFLFKKSNNLETKKQVPDLTKLKKQIGNHQFITIDKIINLIL